jgi:20S proteasome alpha/beta subunit
MGTTILAVKYDGGVIACADSSIFSIIQEHRLVEATRLIESQIKLILFMIILSF